MTEQSRLTSSCHGTGMALEPVYLLTPGKQEIGTVPICTFWKCIKPCGEFRRGVNCPDDFSGAEWSLMLRMHGWPPFIFERRNGRIVPESWIEPKIEKVDKDLAAEKDYE